jgi:hypothetical protein
MTTFNTSEKLYINIISIKKLSLAKNQLYHKINGERENMDAITLAIVTGLAIPLTKDALADAYAALKAALKKKLGDESDVVNAVEQLEKKPDSEGRKATLQEEVENAKVNDDPEIVKLAQDFLNQLKEQPGGQQVITQNISNVKYGATSNSGDASISHITEHGTSKDN